MAHLRELPSVDSLLQKLDHRGLPQSHVKAQVQAKLKEYRAFISEDKPFDINQLKGQIQLALDDLTQPSLRPVINASGIILHTNLGRAPLAAFDLIQGYSNLEYDLNLGKRGRRDAHTGALLEALLGAPAIVVNNNAAAVFLVLNELAAGSEVIISRGELIEIGDGFRIPEIMTRAGVILREVGTTNKTSLNDFRQALNERTRLILRVHRSNFHISGFTSRPSLTELTTLGVPVYEDLGSGNLADLRAFGIHEPIVAESLKAGASLVSFSCDKLLGGPQSGIITGDRVLVERVRANPLYRALRVDKLVLHALQTGLLHLLKQQWDAIPVLRMIREPLEAVKARAETIASGLPFAYVRPAKGAIGGGSTPDQTLESYVVEIIDNSFNPNALALRLRTGAPPIVGRIEKDKFVLDCRTIQPAEVPAVRAAVISLTAPAPAK